MGSISPNTLRLCDAVAIDQVLRYFLSKGYWPVTRRWLGRFDNREAILAMLSTPVYIILGLVVAKVVWSRYRSTHSQVSD